jgi:DNA-directed RNA polymerase specialized sigma24 family protein
MDGMSYTQIAEATGKDVKSVDNALQRSKKKLTGILKRE